ncbi:MAG: hypothetical protein H8K07_21080 [Nitrospira sp.]|jgi:hypothetical protein|nr:hypothetical protein [Nitrospira sp.]MDI3464345.1 hypothetical protein [Nitrospira sp.]
MIHDDKIWLSRRTIVRVLTATACFLLIASIAGQVLKYGFGHKSAYGLTPLFYVDKEGNIPTFFSGILLLLASLLLAFITVLKRASQDAYSRHWAILSLILLYMAVDETCHLHEMLHRPGKWMLGQHAHGIFTYAWIIFGIAMVAAVALSYFKFFLRLPPQAQRQFFTATAVFLSGAIGMELVESYYHGLYGDQTFLYSMFATVEEGLEMAGVIIFNNALMTYLITHYNVSLSLNDSRKKSAFPDKPRDQAA